MLLSVCKAGSFYLLYEREKMRKKFSCRRDPWIASAVKWKCITYYLSGGWMVRFVYLFIYESVKKFLEL